MPGFLDFTNLFRRKPRAEKPPPGKPPAAPAGTDDADAADRFFATLPEGEWVRFNSSSIWEGAFYSHGYSGTLRIRFRAKGGGWSGVTAEYYGVPNTDWVNLCAAGPQGSVDSQGRYFYHHIRSKYPFSYV